MPKLTAALCALLLLASHLPLTVRAESPSYTPEHERAAFLRVYLNALMAIEPDAPLYYDIGTPQRQEALLGGIHHLAARPGDERLVRDDDERLARAEDVLVPQLWRYLQSAGARRDDEGLRLYHEERKDEFAVDDWFRGARILVEEADGGRERAEDVAAKLREPGAGFLDVARAHYRSIGEDQDGMIGRVERGRIHEHLFDLFMEADLSEPFFGPVPVEHGHFIGKVFARGEAGHLPLSEVRDELLPDFIAASVRTAETKILREALGSGLVERAEIAERTSPPEAATIAYRFEGEERTFADVRRALPGVLGDTGSWEYFDAMRERAMLDEVLRGGPEGDAVRDTEAYRTLAAALGAYAAVAEPMREELAAMEEAITEEVLRAYYDERKDEHYRPVDEIRMIHVRVSRNPDGLTGPLERRQASREAWEKIQEIEREIAAAEDLRALDLTHWSEQRDVRIRDASRWVSLSGLHPRLQEMLRDDRTTRFSGFLIDRLEYAFWYQLDRRRPLYPPFERIEERVRQDYIREKTREIRARHLGLDG